VIEDAGALLIPPQPVPEATPAAPVAAAEPEGEGSGG
jgi:hypothetical protein